MRSYVYWIKHKNHTDIKTQGYVGVTSTTVKKRFNAHTTMARKLKEGKSSRKGTINVVHRAMVKYGDDIELVTVCVCDVGYAYWLENYLRPAPNIGWNVSVGGEVVGRLGRPQTDKQKLTMSALNRGKKATEESIKRLSDILRNREISDEERCRRSDVVKNTPLLHSPYVNKDVLSRINEIYDLYLKGYKHWRISKALDLKTSTNYKAMFGKFEQGYNPKNDSELQDYIYHYVIKFGIYTKDSPPTSNSCKETPKNIHINKKGHVVAYISVSGKRLSKTFNVYRMGFEVALDAAKNWLDRQKDNAA